MLTIVLIIALVIVLVSMIVAGLRRQDGNNYFDQKRQPFYAEPQALVNAGLLYQQSDPDEDDRHTYTVTPAGEAGLRAWLREPTNDPGLLEHYFGGLSDPPETEKLVARREAIHGARLSEYERLEQLFVDRPEWRYALAASRIGVHFERACLDFWKKVEAENDEAGDRASRKEGEE